MPKEGQELKGVLEPKVPTANKTEITLKLSQQFLLEKEGNTFNGTIKIGAYDNINSTGPDRYFDGHEINFKIIVNTPPEYRKLIFI